MTILRTMSLCEICRHRKTLKGDVWCGIEPSPNRIEARQLFIMAVEGRIQEEEKQNVIACEMFPPIFPPDFSGEYDYGGKDESWADL